MLPFTLGLTPAILWQAGLWHNPVPYLRADLGTFFLLLGLLERLVGPQYSFYRLRYDIAGSRL